ncbi:MAG: hypothetical protein ABJB01_08505 [Rudaea sp.]
MIVGALILTLLSTPSVAAAPVETRELVTDLPTDFLPEGVEWDAKHSRFLISSIRQHRIASVDPSNGHATDFGDAPGSVLGVHIDAKTNVVWAVWTQFGHGFKDNKNTGLSAWSTDDAHHIGDWPLPDKNPQVNLGDLVIVDAHTLVVSDSGTGAVWRFDMKSHTFTSIVAAGKFKSPQGMSLGRTSGTIYLADYSTGLWRIQLKSGAVTQLATPAGAELRGLDGLYRRGDQLIAIQNGTKTPRVLVITLDKSDLIIDVRHWIDLTGAADEPSLGTFSNDTFWFVADGQWNEYDEDLKPKPDVKLLAPKLRALPLSELAKQK